MIAPEDKDRWIRLARLLQGRGAKYLNDQQPKSALEAAKIMEIGTRIERAAMQAEAPIDLAKVRLEDTDEPS